MTVKLLAIGALFAGCSHNLPYSATNDIELQKWVTVETTDGAEIDALVVASPMGGTAFQASGGYIDPMKIRRVTEERTLRGMGEGFLIGAGAGILAGVVVGFADGDDPPCMGDHQWLCFSLTGGEKAVVFGVLLGGLGGVLGVAVGAVRGSRMIYEDRATGVTITPNGPPGSVAGLTITY